MLARMGVAGAQPFKNFRHRDARLRVGIGLFNLGFDQGVKFWAFGDEVRFVSCWFWDARCHIGIIIKYCASRKSDTSKPLGGLAAWRLGGLAAWRSWGEDSPRHSRAGGKPSPDFNHIIYREMDSRLRGSDGVYP